MARDNTHGREGIRHGADFDALSEQLATLREIPVTRTVTNAALHYDADYDLLATVLRFESRWIARRGSLD